MALRPSALGCTHIAADACFTGEGRTRWGESREQNDVIPTEREGTGIRRHGRPELHCARGEFRLSSVLDRSGNFPETFVFQSSSQTRARVPAPHGHLSLTTLPASRRSDRSFRFRGRSLGCGISRWGRAGCRRGGRSPSSRWGLSARPGSRSRWELIRRCG